MNTDEKRRHLHFIGVHRCSSAAIILSTHREMGAWIFARLAKGVPERRMDALGRRSDAWENPAFTPVRGPRLFIR